MTRWHDHLPGCLICQPDPDFPRLFVNAGQRLRDAGLIRDEPDHTGVDTAERLTADRFTGSPGLVIEVLSPFFQGRLLFASVLRPSDGSSRQATEGDYLPDSGFAEGGPYKKLRPKEHKNRYSCILAPKQAPNVVEYSLISSCCLGRGLPWKSRRKTYKRAF
jgi:hypothetical protein